MADRQVTKSRKDGRGNITGLCNPGQWWSPRSSTDAISDIDTKAHAYFVLWADGMRTEVRVVNGPGGKYLRTDRDSAARNNLDDLQDC